MREEGVIHGYLSSLLNQREIKEKLKSDHLQKRVNEIKELLES